MSANCTRMKTVRNTRSKGGWSNYGASLVSGLESRAGRRRGRPAHGFQTSIVPQMAMPASTNTAHACNERLVF